MKYKFNILSYQISINKMKTAKKMNKDQLNFGIDIICSLDNDKTLRVRNQIILSNNIKSFSQKTKIPTHRIKHYEKQNKKFIITDNVVRKQPLWENSISQLKNQAMILEKDGWKESLRKVTNSFSHIILQKINNQENIQNDKKIPKIKIDPNLKMEKEVVLQKENFLNSRKNNKFQLPCQKIKIYNHQQKRISCLSVQRKITNQNQQKKSQYISIK